MKISILSYVYPVILKNVVKKQLSKYYSEKMIKNVLIKTKNEYKAILKRAPDIGGSKNIFLSSYLMGAYLIALYKVIKDDIALSEMDLIISEGLKSFKFMKNQMKGRDLLSSKYKNKMIKAGKWCYKNKDRYPSNWQVEVITPQNPDLTHIVFTNCGLCTLCNNEGIPEFISSLCATDYITMSFAKCKLERPMTLGKGNSCCDFYITKM